MRLMKSGVYALLGLILLCTTTSTDTPDLIYWDENRQLSWNDFEGEPRHDIEQISALTSSGIVHYKGCKDGKIIYKVQAYFEKNESWVKDVARTDHHLHHEQLHFDITELYARKLRRALSEKNYSCGQEAQFDAFIDQFLRFWEVEQQSFDYNTQHSIDRAQQEQWSHKIEEKLILFEEFMEPVEE